MATVKTPSGESPDRPTLPGEVELLRAAARGTSLVELSESICRAIEDSIDGARASILGLDPSSETLSFVAGPSLPTEYTSMIKGAAIGPNLGTCSQSAFAGTPVVTSKIRDDSGWSAFLDIADEHNFVGAWSWPLLSPDGEVVGTIGLYFDRVREATRDERRKMTQWSELTSDIIGDQVARFASEIRQSKLLELLSDARSLVFNCSQDGRVREVVSSGAPFDDLDTASIVGTVFADLLDDTDEKAWQQVCERASSTGRVQRIEPLYTTIDTRRWAWNCSVSHNEGRWGSPTGWLILVEDVTEIYELRRERAHSQRIRSVGRIGAGVAHEINNPLAYVEGNASFLATQLQATDEDLDRDELLAALEDLQDGVSRIKRIVHDLTAYAGGRDEMASVDLHDVMESALNLLKVEIGNGFEFEQSLEDDLHVWGNDTRLTQVIINLMRNAVQAMRESETEHPRVTLDAFREDAEVIIEVRDNGPGIPDAIANRIFDPFFSSRPSSAGTGLGLSIVQDIVEEMSGHIDFETESGAGTCFRMRFVAAEANTKDDSDTSRSGARNLDILLVDDDPLVSRAIERMLGSDQHLTHASRALDALERVEDHAFDVILVDLMMPDIDGVRFLQRLRISHPEQARRVGFITAGITDDFVREFVENADVPIGYKPFDRRGLDELIDKVAGR